MTWFAEIAFLLVIPSSFYVSVACIFRLRYKDISPLWSTLYVGFLVHSLWAVSNTLGGVTDSKDVTITLLIVLYMLITDKSWLRKVPVFAKRKRIRNA